MRLFDKASLVLTPNGYKEGKLYSIKPTDGSGDLDVVRATTATRVNSDGLIESVATNVPRLDYTNGSCPSILVEPQRTNLALYSEQFDNASWTKTSSNISQNSTISPSGALDADLLTSTVNSVTSNLNKTISIPSGSATFSVFAKAGNYNIFRIGNVSSSERAAWFDLSTGSVIGTVNGGTASVENFGNGWFRCIFTANSAESGTSAFLISISSEANSSNSVAGANIYFWGAQLEVGSYATSYIPTVGSAVTRNADVINNAGISDLINSEEGTFFVKLKILKNGGEVRHFEISDGTFNNVFRITISSVAGRFEIRYRVGGVSIIDAATTGLDHTTIDNFFIRYNNGTIDFIINGDGFSRTVYSGSGLTVLPTNTLNTINILQGISLGIKNLQLYKTALTDTELAQLTTI